MTKKLVIIGAGMAAGRVLDHLTDAQDSWDVTLFNAEPRGTYNRIMLSPVLSGDKTHAELRALLERCRQDEVKHRDEARQSLDRAPSALVRAWCWLVGAGSAVAVAFARRL